MSGIKLVSSFALAFGFISPAVAETPIGNLKTTLGLNARMALHLPDASKPNSSENNSAQRNSKTKHITIVLVGDTGYAPSGVSPKPNGSAKHGRWFNWAETTRKIEPHINGDINFANMESVVSASRSLKARPKAFNFVTHPNGVRHLAKTGFNLFSMANNHSFDYGAKGVRHSLQHMDEMQADGLLHHSGIGLNRDQAATAVEFEKKGTRFAMSSIGIGASGGGLPRATNKRPGQLNLYNRDDRRLLADNLANSQSDFRMVSVHRGIERQIKVDRDEIRQARNFINGAANADLFIGHHAHVSRGVEINQGKLIFYGLGNFLHHGTANMAGSGGCRDYSILARVHLVKEDNEKPQLAAVEVVPLTNTHNQVKPMSPRKAARRVAVLNGLARQFDDPSKGASGVRFDVRSDGTGLYCTPNASKQEATNQLCEGYRPYNKQLARLYRSAVSSCGGSFKPTMIAAVSKKTTKKPAKPGVKKKVEQPVKLAKLESPKATDRKITGKNNASKAGSKPAGFKYLNNSQLARLSGKAQTRYWTRYWYVKRGRKIPSHLR